MENLRNKIRLSFSNNPELEEVFILKELGHTCKLEIEFVLTEKDKEGVEGTVKSVYAPNYDRQTPPEFNPETGKQEAKTVKESKTIKPGVDAPIMVVMGAGK